MPPHHHCSFFIARYGDHRDLHSFPTRRSSDLQRRICAKAAFPYTATEDDGIRPTIAWSKRTPSEIGEAEHRSEEPRLNSSHLGISYAVFCLKKKKKNTREVSKCR